MKLNKKLYLSSAVLALMGAGAIIDTEEVNANPVWVARTVEEVKQDISFDENDQVSYEVQYGDTLSVIASALDVDMSALVEINNISNADLIMPGAIISTTLETDTDTQDNNNEYEIENIQIEQPSGETREFEATREPSGQTEVTEVETDNTEEEAVSEVETTEEPQAAVEEVETDVSEETVESTEKSVQPTYEESNDSTYETVESSYEEPETNEVNETASSRQTYTEPVKETTVPVVSNSNLGANVSSVAQAQVGVPYRWGGQTPSGFDCSGLVLYAYAQSGVSLPRTAGAQSIVGYEVGVSGAQAGDILYWGGQGTAYHTAIYIGGGQFVTAPEPGRNVEIQTLSSYWYPSGARRVN